MPRTINRLESVATIGIDIGKNTFYLVGLDRNGAIVLRQLSRRQVEARLANMPPCLIGMEPWSVSGFDLRDARRLASTSTANRRAPPLP
jgi:transposase